MTEILRACHGRPCGGHFSDKWTSYKVLHSSFTGQAFLRMLLGMLEDVTVAKEWVDLRHRRRFLYSLRS